MDKRVQHLRQQCANNKVCGTSHPGLCIANSNDDGKQCMLDMRMCAVGACVLCQPHPTLGNVGGHALYAAENSPCVLGLLCFYNFPGMVSETSRCLLLRPTQWCRIAWKHRQKDQQAIILFLHYFTINQLRCPCCSLHTARTTSGLVVPAFRALREN